MRSFVLPALMSLLLVAGANAQGEALLQGPERLGSGIYKCEIGDGRFVDDEGAQQRGKADTDWFWQNYRHFTFDANNGVFSTASEAIVWVVTRAGNSEWDLVAHLPGADPFYNVLRIQVWNDPMKFSLTDGTDHFTGKCYILN